MKKVFCRSLALALSVVLVASAASAKIASNSRGNYQRESYSALGNSDVTPGLNGLAASAAQSTTWLLVDTFDSGGSCITEGWTNVDLTSQDPTVWAIDSYWHVHNFGTNPVSGYSALRDNQSLWLGTEPDTLSVYLCSYGSPGYGNNWNQSWCSTNCLTITDGGDADTDPDIGVAFVAHIESEFGWDGLSFEYRDCLVAGTWESLAGGTSTATGWTGDMDFPPETNSFEFNVPGVTSAKVRFHFTSDGSYSDQDNLNPTVMGAVLLDSLTAEGLGVEDFEGETHGDQSTGDWEACPDVNYDSAGGHSGPYMALFPGIGQIDVDPCGDDYTCLWAALQGSTYYYTCATPPQPTQVSVPFGGIAAVGEDTYLADEVWSPYIPISGSGSRVILQFQVYRDLPIPNLIFYVWHVRSVYGNCPGIWRDTNNVYYSPGAIPDWIRHGQSVGGLLDLLNATHVQVSLGVWDMCLYWCPGSGCHAGSPYLDTVKLYRVATTGPQYSVDEYSLFQDSFANDGTLAGKVRADIAVDIRTDTDPIIDPGDSAYVVVTDPSFGLAADPVTPNRKAVYCYVAVWPQGQLGKSGAGLTDDAARWPHRGTQVINTITWDYFRMDSTTALDRYCIDLNDNLFEAGDTVCFFYAAKSADGPGTVNYYSIDWGTDPNASAVAGHAMEFTCLPAGGYNRDGDILFVDGNDQRGGPSQNFWYTTFQALGLADKIDRYDVRGPSSGVANRPEGRVYNVSQQLVGVYRKILWDCVDNSFTLGDGSGGNNEKTDDYQMVYDFLSGLTNPGGVYICGDDVSEQLNAYSGQGALDFRSIYLSYTHVKGSHTTAAPAPQLPITPKGIDNPAGTCLTDDIFIYGGCPLINDFDVMAGVSPTSTEEMWYDQNAANHAAVVSQATNNGSTTVGVVFSGFSFIYIRDDNDGDGVFDRDQHLYDILWWLGNSPPQPTAAGPALKNELSQNYPNPFNPQTTIAFSIKSRGAVSVKVYNVAGQLVRTLVNENRAAGPHTVVWDGRNDSGSPVASGVYFYKLVANNFSQTKKMVLLK
jgi:hypothetical protein